MVSFSMVIWKASFAAKSSKVSIVGSNFGTVSMEVSTPA